MEEERGLVEKTKRRGGDDELEVRTFTDAIRVFTEESKKLWMLAATIPIASLFTYGINSSVQILAGHLSALQLFAVSIALTLCSNFTTGFLLSMGSALETLSRQAFGAGQVGMLSIYMQRTWIIFIFSSILMAPIYIFATPILSFLGQQPDIAYLAGRFALLIPPPLICHCHFLPLPKVPPNSEQGHSSCLHCFHNPCSSSWSALALHLSWNGAQLGQL